MKKLIVRPLIAFLIAQALFFGTPQAIHAEEMTCPTPTVLDIDIKPADTLNRINLAAHGLLPVALLSTPDFDASQFTPEMAHLSDAGVAMEEGCDGADAKRWNLDDVNKDGLLDLVFFFRIQDLNLTSESTDATLMTHGSYGSGVMHIHGTDPVEIKP